MTDVVHPAVGASERSPRFRPPTAGRGRNERLWPWWLASTAAAIGFWQIAIISGLLSERSFSRPADVGRWLWEWHSSGDSLRELSFTLQGAMAGYVLGVASGSLVALLFVAVPWIAEVMDPFMAMFNGIPKVVIAPFLITAFGFGLASKIAVSVLLVFFVAFFNIYAGLKSVDRAMVNNVRALGGSRWRLAKDLYLPAIVSWAMSTLRLGVGFALVGVVVGEFVGSTRGVGRLIKVAGDLAQPDALIGGLITLAVVAGVIDRALVVVERRFSKWTLF